MIEFNVGDTVFIKNELVECYSRIAKREGHEVLLPGQERVVQIGLAKDMPFTIVAKRTTSFYITNFSDNWGAEDYQFAIWEGKRCKAWVIGVNNLEKRASNTISLYELNRGL